MPVRAGRGERAAAGCADPVSAPSLAAFPGLLPDALVLGQYWRMGAVTAPPAQMGSGQAAPACDLLLACLAP